MVGIVQQRMTCGRVSCCLRCREVGVSADGVPLGEPIGELDARTFLLPQLEIMAKKKSSSSKKKTPPPPARNQRTLAGFLSPSGTKEAPIVDVVDVDDDDDDEQQEPPEKRRRR